jgi:hypothetical protein
MTVNAIEREGTLRTLSFERVRNRPYLALYLASLVFLAVWAPLAHILFDSMFLAANENHPLR